MEFERPRQLLWREGELEVLQVYCIAIPGVPKTQLAELPDRHLPGNC